MKDKIGRMHRAYGMDKSHVCKDCCNFVRGRYHNRTLKKCKAYGLTHSEASDWANSWTACGLFNKPFEDIPFRPMIENRGNGGGDTSEPLQGQMEMEA